MSQRRVGMETHLKELAARDARIVELEAENERILGSHDAYAAEAEDAQLDRKDAEAALERALADGAAMRESFRETVMAALAILPMQRDPHPDDNLQKLVNMAGGLLKDSMDQILSDHPGDKLLAVVKAARELDIVGIEAMRMALRRIARSEALPDALMRDILDRSEAKDG